MQIPNLAVSHQFTDPVSLDKTQIYYIFIAATLTPLFAGIMLWLITNKLSDFILRDIDTTGNEPASATHIQAIAISTVGLIVFVLSIPHLINALMQFIDITDGKPGLFKFQPYAVTYLLSASAKALLGIGLILGAGGIMRLLHKFRSMGTQ